MFRVGSRGQGAKGPLVKMESERLQKVLKTLKEKAPDGQQIHPKYGWGSFLDLLLDPKVPKK